MQRERQSTVLSRRDPPARRPRRKPAVTRSSRSPPAVEIETVSLQLDITTAISQAGSCGRSAGGIVGSAEGARAPSVVTRQMDRELRRILKRRHDLLCCAVMTGRLADRARGRDNGRWGRLAAACGPATAEPALGRPGTAERTVGQFATVSPREEAPGDPMVIDCPASTHRQIRPSSPVWHPRCSIARRRRHRRPGVATQQVVTVVEWRSRGNPSEE